MLDSVDISSRVRELKQLYFKRDQMMEEIRNIREGNIDNVFPGMFTDDVPKSIIANHIDIAARDTAEMLAPLPSFNCSAANMSNDTARKYADKKTKGIQHYIQFNELGRQMYTAADYFVTYGLMPFVVEPDFKEKMPRIVAFDPRGAYPDIDRWGRMTSFTRSLKKPVQELCEMYPEYARQLLGRWGNPTSTMLLEVLFYQDAEQMMMLVPERNDLVLEWAPNPMGECCYRAAERPGVTDIPRGQFDDVMWIQVARNRFAMMAMEAAEQSVEAPLALPYDVQEFAVGPMATIRTNSPEKIRRVGMEMPTSAFQEGAVLDMEMQKGSRYPGVRTGNIDASVITGQGINALQAGFDNSVRAAQEVFRTTLRDVVGLCLRMDERYWPDVERDIRGQSNGVPYSIRWKPSRDIDGDHTCDVTYGFAMGLDPNRALVALLQMRGDRLISRDFTRRQFPFDINVSAEEANIEVEELRSALLQSIAAYSQAIPALAQQGQDPGQILYQLGQVINDRQKGKTLEDSIARAFAPPPAPEEQAMPSGPQLPGEGSPVEGLGPNGLPPGVAPGQATMGPGGRPDLLTMLAGLNSGGVPTTNVNVKRSLPA